MHRQIEIKCKAHRLQTTVLLRLGWAKLDAAETFLSDKNRAKSFLAAPRNGEIGPDLYPEYWPLIIGDFFKALQESNAVRKLS